MAGAQPVSLLARIAAIEQRLGPSGPYAVLIHVCQDGTSVTICWLGREHEHTTLSAYRARFPDGVGCIERWYVMGDAEEQPHRMSAQWAARG